MSKRWRLLGALVLLSVLAWRLDWAQLGSAFGALRLELWALAVLVYVLAQVASSLRWQLLAGALGYGGPWHRYLAHYFIGMFFNLVLPTSVGGDVVRAWYLARAEGGRAAALVSVFADRASGLGVLVVLACIAAICSPVALPSWLGWLVAALGAGTVVGVAALPALCRWPAGGKLGRLAEVLGSYAGQPRLLAVAALLGVVVQLANVVLLWLIGEGLGLSVPLAYYGVVMPLVALLTLLPLSINGMGLRELGTVVLLAPLGVAAEQSATLAFLQFAAFSATSLLGGVFYLVGGYPQFRAAPVGAAGEGPTMQSLSVVVPIKDERDNLRPLHEKLSRALLPLVGTTLRDYELLFVDDGSSDGSFGVLEELASKDERVKVIALRRNFGQTPALRAGIDWSRGDVLVTMDGDLQNDPADIPMLLAKLNEGHDAVFGLRKHRQDRMLMRKLPSLAGNWLIRKVTGTNIKDLGCTLRAMKRDLAEALPLYGEMHRFVPVLAKMHGARVIQVDVEHHPRVAGQTKYNLSRSVRVLLDLITVKFLHTYVTRPMHALGLPGLVAMGLGVVSLLATIGMKHLCNPPVFMTGNPLLLLSVMLELVGVQCISMGLLGELLARTYFESQGKSAYSVRATLNVEGAERKRAA